MYSRPQLHSPHMRAPQGITTPAITPQAITPQAIAPQAPDSVSPASGLVAYELKDEQGRILGWILRPRGEIVAVGPEAGTVLLRRDLVPISIEELSWTGSS